MSAFSRRALLAGAATSLAASSVGAIEPFTRINPRMKGLSLSAYSMRRYMKWSKGERRDGQMEMLGFVDYCAELGLEGAELTAYFFEEPLPPGRLNELKRRAHINGLDITGGAIGNNFTAAPGSDDAKSQLAYTRTWIDRYADLGAPVVRIFSGKPRGGLSHEEALRNVTANLTEALSYAERRGVLLGLENHDFLTNIDYLLELLGRFGSRWLGVVWDSANLDPTPDPYAELARIAPYALVAQFKVTTRVNGESARADFSKLVEILRNADYSGYLVLEYEESEDPYEAIPRYLKQLRALL